MRNCLGSMALAALAWLLVDTASIALGEAPSGVDPAAAERAKSLVAELGAKEFARRERATEQLIELGLPSLASLEAGAVSNDREIRYRARRILDIVREMDFQRRLTAFAADSNPDHDYQLPGWSAYREIVGHDGEARLLFVEMQRAEPQIMQAIEQSPQTVAKLLTDRAQEPQRAMLVFQFEASVGSVAAHLFAAAVEGVQLTPQAEQLVHTYCSQYGLQQSAQSDPEMAILRKMLGAWIRRAEGENLYQILYLAMQYNVKEGLVPATRLIRESYDPQADNSTAVQVRQLAILAVAKLGDESHISLLQPLLDDRSESVRQGKATTLICDVALAVSIELAGQDHIQFGFSSKLAKNPQYVFSIQSIGFEDDAKRQTALEKWREHWSQRSAAQPPDAEPPAEQP